MRNLKTCSWQPGDSREQWCHSHLKLSRLKIQEETTFQFKSKGKKRSVSQLITQASGFPYYSAILFCSGFWLVEAHSALPSLQVQLLISCRNTLTFTPRIMFDQMPGHLIPYSGRWLEIFSNLCRFLFFFLRCYLFQSFLPPWIEIVCYTLCLLF